MTMLQLDTPIVQAAEKPRADARRFQRRAGYWLALPAATLLFLFLLLPSGIVLLLSLTDYTLGTDRPRFIGFDNYTEMVSDLELAQSAVNTALYVTLVVPLSIALGLSAALLIEGRTHFKSFYRTVYFLPVTGTLVALATAWEIMLHPTLGLFNTILAQLGLGKLGFLSDPGTALVTLAAIGIWQLVGFNMVLFLAGLSTIPKDLYDAAAIDGADRGVKRFLLVTWPMIGPVTMFVTVMTVIRAFSVFETVSVLTDGGPLGSTEVLLFTLFEQAFRYFRIGYAAAIAVVFLVIVALLALLQARALDARTHYV